MQLSENGHHPTIVWFRDNRASCAECDERREIGRPDRLHPGHFARQKRAIGPAFSWLTRQAV